MRGRWLLGMWLAWGSALALAAEPLPDTLPGTKPLHESASELNPAEGEFARQMDELKRAADAAHALGTNKLRIFTFTRVADPDSILGRIVEELNKALAVAKAHDVILVVVLGGVGLSGGRGGVRNVLVGTLLIGTFLNGMTIMDVQYTMQNAIKAVILLAAIVIDQLINPRDEQTSQHGDI